MLAVSGIDHTVKIFSPDRRAQFDARHGINLSEAKSLGSSRTGLGARARRRVMQQRATAEAVPAPSAEAPSAQVQTSRNDSSSKQTTQDTSDHNNVDEEERDDDKAAARPRAGQRHADDDPDPSEVDVAALPPTNGGLASRRQMHQLYQITSQNDQRRQGGMREAHVTVCVFLPHLCSYCIVSPSHKYLI